VAISIVVVSAAWWIRDYPGVLRTGLRLIGLCPRQEPVNAESPPTCGRGAFCEGLFGGVLLSHTLSGAVPSALEGLASGFGMGPGVSPPLWPPKLCETEHEAHTFPCHRCCW
jgi:hypothetical protein